MIVKRMVGDKPNAPLEQYIVETVDDLSEIISDAEGPKDITRTLPFGSIAFVIDNKTFYMVGFDSNNNKTWIDISESSSGKPEQSKTVTPTKSGVTVRPDTGYALSSVEVEPIPDQYPDVSDVTATAGTVLTGSDFVDASGTLVHGSCDYDADTSDATATAGQIEAGATAYVNGAKVTGTMPIRTTDVEISDLSPVPIPAGSYDGTTAAKLADPTEVDGRYILEDHEILGVRGQAQAGVDTLAAYFANTLTSVSDSSVTSLVASFFEGKTALTSVSFPNLTTMGARAFYGCTGLVSANVSELTSLPERSFTFCSSLVEIDLPNATSIDLYSFNNCTSLRRAYAPNATSIGSFNGCSSLVDTDFSSATSVSANAFHANTSMTEIVLPNVTSIQQYAFWDSTLLNVVVLRKRASLGATNAFDGTKFASGQSGGTLYCLQDDVSWYQSATNWSAVLARPNNQILPIEGSPYEVTT